MTINERVRLIRRSLKMNQTDFGSRIDASQNYLSSIEKGHREVTEKIIKIICFEFNVNESWLRTGEEEMFIQSETFSLDEYAKKNSLSSLEIDIMKSYMEVDANIRKGIMEHFKKVFEAHSETAYTVEPSPEQIAAEEAEAYRQEVLSELKGGTSSASDVRSEPS